MPKTYLVALCTCLLAASVSAADLHIAPDRMAVVDGQRTFILGLYENPQDDDVVKEVAAAGFNLVMASESQESLDRLARHGLWAWLTTGYRIALHEDTDARKAQLEAMVETYGNHPALLVWEVPDEALWNCWQFARMWRVEDEPAQQRERIDALEDTALQEDLRARLDAVRRLRDEGELAESETLANSIWEALGQSPPKPDFGLSNAAERAWALCGGMRDGYALLRELDPRHPVWMNHAPRNQLAQLAAFNEAADIVGCDIYPVPRSAYHNHSDIALTTVAAVGAYTTRMQDAAPGKPVWMVLQGFGWSDLGEREQFLRRPTLEETRFMAYNAIVRGARGILYWGTYKIEKDSQFWNDLLAAVRELSDLQHVLAAPDAGLALTTSFEETWGSVDREVEVLAKEVDGQVWIFAVNEWIEPLRYTIHGLRGLNGQVFIEARDQKEATVVDETLTLTIRGHGVHVLQPKR
jgi:hypothetical protein